MLQGRLFSVDDDVTFVGEETCELVGCFFLFQLQAKFGQNIGLYRHDGLAITDTTPRATENIKQEICRIFKDNGLRITIDANKQVVNFLDVTFNLAKNSNQPYTKPNTTLQYVHCESNHPTNTIKKKNKKTYQQESTNASRTSHPTKPHLTKPHTRTRKH